IVARNISPIDSAVVTLGEFHAGTAVNVIADSARLSGTVRYFNPEFVYALLSRRCPENDLCSVHRCDTDDILWLASSGGLRPRY
ncbi:MAG: hypothetical protein AAF773_25465, partial [Cyanobacteria bacterium P01_D01_bin.115]